MFGWGLWKKNRRTDEPALTSEEPAIVDEWQYLREQPDHDEAAMATVHARPASSAGELSAAPGTAPVGPRSTGEARHDRRPSERTACEAGELVLEVVGPQGGAQRTIHGPAVIGRTAPADAAARFRPAIAPDIDLYDDDAVSRRHAEIQFRHGRFWLVDLGSTNGTWHNGSPLTPGVEVPLAPGDRVELGEFSLIRVLERAEDPLLTDEDLAIADLLHEAMQRPELQSRPPYPERERLDHYEEQLDELPDLLDLVLELGEADGLIAPVAVGAAGAPPARPGMWKLHDPHGAELPLL